MHTHIQVRAREAFARGRAVAASLAWAPFAWAVVCVHGCMCVPACLRLRHAPAKTRNERPGDAHRVYAARINTLQLQQDRVRTQPTCAMPEHCGDTTDRPPTLTFDKNSNAAATRPRTRARACRYPHWPRFQSLFTLPARQRIVGKKHTGWKMFGDPKVGGELYGITRPALEAVMASVQLEPHKCIHAAVRG